MGKLETEEVMNVPQLDFSTYPSQIFWLIACALCLFFFVKNVFLPRVVFVLEGRDRRIQGDLAKAQEVRAQAQQVKESYEVSLLESKREARLRAEGEVLAYKTQHERRLNSLREEFLKKQLALEKKRFLHVCVDQDFVSILLKEKRNER